jgi:hypothetical protein
MRTDRALHCSSGLVGPFLALIGAQAAHSVEEYLGQLYGLLARRGRPAAHSNAAHALHLDDP